MHSTPNVMIAHLVSQVTSRRTSNDILSYWNSSRRAHKTDQSVRRVLTVQIKSWTKSRPKGEWITYLSKTGHSMTHSMSVRFLSMKNSLTLSTIRAKVSISQSTPSVCQSEFEVWNTYLIREMRILLQTKWIKITANRVAVDGLNR